MVTSELRWFLYDGAQPDLKEAAAELSKTDLLLSTSTIISRLCFLEPFSSHRSPQTQTHSCSSQPFPFCLISSSPPHLIKHISPLPGECVCV